MRRIVAVVSLFALSACATQMPSRNPSTDQRLGRAVEQPMRDLSIIREQAPDVLQRAADKPYSTEGMDSCAAIHAEIRLLNKALGPDVNAEGEESNDMAASFAADLIHGVVGLPFRGIIRRVTGAADRDKNLRAAVLAGMVRRGFLKGRLGMMACELVPPPPPAASATPPTPGV